MTLEKAIIQLVREYDKALQIQHIKKPVAYALYKVWRIADEEKKTNDRGAESSKEKV